MSNERALLVRILRLARLLLAFRGVRELETRHIVALLVISRLDCHVIKGVLAETRIALVDIGLT